jgi:hypothetical protein
MDNPFSNLTSNNSTPRPGSCTSSVMVPIIEASKDCLGAIAGYFAGATRL